MGIRKKKRIVMWHPGLRTASFTSHTDVICTCHRIVMWHPGLRTASFTSHTDVICTCHTYTRFTSTSCDTERIYDSVFICVYMTHSAYMIVCLYVFICHINTLSLTWWWHHIITSLSLSQCHPQSGQRETYTRISPVHAHSPKNSYTHVRLNDGPCTHVLLNVGPCTSLYIPEIANTHVHNDYV